MITKNDLKVIKECLVASGVKNSEFQESTNANKDAYIAFVYNNQNYKIKVSNLIPIKNISLDGTNLIPDDNGNLSIDLPKSKWDVITVNYYGNTPPPPQAQEGTLCYNKSEKSLWRYYRPGGWKQVPWEENFYYIKGLNMLCLYISELGLLEIPKDKQDKLVSGQNIKTINGQSILGSGDITISGEGTFTSFPTLLPIKGTVVTTENNTNTTEVLNVGEDKSVYYDYRLEKFVVKTLQNVYYTQWEGDYSTSEQYESISFVYTEYPETTIYKIDKTRPDTLLPISDCSVVEIVEWTNNAEDYPLGYDYPEGSYAISEDYLYRLIDGNWTLVGNTIDSTSSYNKRYYLIYENALYTYKLTDGITPVIVPVSQDTIDAAIAPINQQLSTINNKLEQDEEDIQDLKLVTNILQGQKQSPLQVTIVTTNRGIAERTYTGTEGELCYIDNILYRGFAWRVGNTYYSNWTNVKPLPANLAGIDIIFEEKEGILYFYKITESGLEELNMQSTATSNYKELLPITEILDGLIITSQDTPIPGGIVIYNPTRKRFYYKDADSQTYHSVWSDDLGVPSSDDYQHAELIYMYTNDILSIYKVTPFGLVGTKSQEVDPIITSDSNNPVTSSTIYDALETKQKVLQSGINIKTLNNQSLLGSGNIEIKSGANVLAVSYAGDTPQQKEGAWVKDQIYYDTSNGFFYKCDRTGDVPNTQIEIADGTILYIEQPYRAFYCYDNQIDGEPIPFAPIVDDDIKENSHHLVENAAIYSALLDKQDSLNAKNGIIIRPKGETENVSAKYIIELDPNQLDSIIENLQAVIVMKQKVDAMWEELHPSPEPEPQLRVFDPLVGNWGSIHIDKDPEDITVEDVMDEDYDVPLLEDLEEDEVQIWDSGDTPPEGKYFITGTKAGFIPGSSLSKSNAYYNRKLLRALMSDEGDYADCIGVVLGSEGTAECYCINGIPGDGTDSQGYVTEDEGLTNSDRWNRGVVCKKDFTIKGLTTDNDGKPTSGFRQTHQSGPMIATTHSLNVLGAYMEAYYQGPGLIYIDSVNGIDQIQIKDSYFTTSTNYRYTTKFIVFAARDEYPIDAYSVLRETNAIKDLLIYNNTFIGAFAIYNQGSDSTFSVISCNRFLDSCRIVNNKFPLCPYYAFDIAVPNTGSDGGGPNGTIRAFTQCPIYIVGNEIIGMGEVVNVTSGTQYVSMMLEMSRTYILHNTFKNKVVKQSGASSTSIGGYISSTNLYFCNNTCEDFARFSTSRSNNAVIMFKGMQIPSTYSDNHYPTSRYIVNNVFKQNISRIKSWWDAFLATSSATQADRDLDFDTCLGTSILSTTLNFVEETVLSGNTFNIRAIRGISDSDPHRSDKITIENNTINFGKFYPGTAKSCIFTVRTKELSIKNNRLVENVNPTPLVKISTTTSYPDPGANKTTITGNDYLSGVVLQKIVGSAGLGTPTTIANTGGSVIPVSEITTEEQAILDGDNR